MDFIRIDMAAKKVIRTEMPSEYEGWGGRGLTSLIVSSEVEPRCDPLGVENKLILAPGLLSGTSMVNTSRLSVGAKSPLTGGIKESNAGGSSAAYLGRMGIAAVIIEGAADNGERYLLHIDTNGNGILKPADDLAGLRTYALTKQLLEGYGAKASVLCTGPAGENRMPIASIQTNDLDGKPCRAAGRGGLGAVMGAKGLKAIVIEQVNQSQKQIADPEVFKTAVKTFASAVRDSPFSGKVLPQFGTAALMGIVNTMGAFPCMNATRGTMDGWEKISGETIAELINQRGGQQRHKGCAQCIIDCSNQYVDKKGNYLTGSLEYETLWAMGGMTGIDDPDTIARMDFLCDDIGLDTMSTGVAISVAMDAGHRAFGDGPAALALVEEIAADTIFGRLLGSGPEAVGKHFKHTRVPVVKKQSIAGYDPRGMQGMAVTYATSPMGADHTAGNLIGAYSRGLLDPLEKDGQVEASNNTQITVAALDSTGLCLFTLAAANSPDGKNALFDAMGSLIGRTFGPDDFISMGKTILQREQEFNRRAGMTEKDDRLPRFFYDEPLPPHGSTVLFNDGDFKEAIKAKIS